GVLLSYIFLLSLCLITFASIGLSLRKSPLVSNRTLTEFPTILWYCYPPAAYWCRKQGSTLITAAPDHQQTVVFPFLPPTPNQTLRENEQPLTPNEIDLSFTDQLAI